ncbi:MAG: hypothetical protein ACJATF_000510, partial [Flavobacteriales bacterium]
MRKIFLPTLFCFFLATSLIAEVDSLKYLNRADTIYLRLSDMQEKLIEHRLEGAQTLYALSKYYGMSVNQIFDYNPNLNRNNYGEGVRVNIPVPAISIITHIPADRSLEGYIPVFYRVRKSDTLYKLSKSYFGIPMDTLVSLNNLVDNTLSLGQLLHIGWLSRAGIPKADRRVKGGLLDKKNMLLAKKYERDAEWKREFNHKGIAYWQQNGVKSVDLYAMHREAKIGSIIAVNNPMTKRTVYAKVIARLPESIYP